MVVEGGSNSIVPSWGMVVEVAECEKIEGVVDGVGGGGVRVVCLCLEVLCPLRTILEMQCSHPCHMKIKIFLNLCYSLCS